MKKIVAVLIALILVFSFSISAFAANFTPSVVNKDSPIVIKPGTSVQGLDLGAIIVDKNGDLVEPVEFAHLIITGVADADNSSEIPDAARIALKAAYAELSKKDIKLSELVSGLDEIVKKDLGSDKGANNLVIRDLFDVSLVNSKDKTALNVEGNKLVVTFDIGIKANKAIYAIQFNTEISKWEIVPMVRNNNDGTVTCEFSQCGPVAFLVESTPKTPTTGDNSVSLYIWIGLAGVSLIGLVAVLVIKSKKDKTTA